MTGLAAAGGPCPPFGGLNKSGPGLLWLGVNQNRNEGSGREDDSLTVSCAAAEWPFESLPTAAKRRDWSASSVSQGLCPFYEHLDINVGAVLTDNGREFCGKPETHPYELMLAVEGIKHRTTQSAVASNHSSSG